MPPILPTHAGAFVVAVWRHWKWVVTSSGLAAGLLIVERWTGRNVPSWLFWFLVPLGALWACYLAWRDERLARIADDGGARRRIAGEGLAALIAEGNACQASFDAAPTTHDDIRTRGESDKEKIDAWIERVQDYLRSQCPEHAPSFERGIRGVTLPGNLIEVYLERLVEIQRLLLAAR